MAKNIDSTPTRDAEFDPDELTDGFEEDSEPLDDLDNLDPASDPAVDSDDLAPEPVLTTDDQLEPPPEEDSDDDSDDDDSEPALDDILLKVVRPESILDDPYDEESPDEGEDPGLADLSLVVEPIQPDEFRCKSCRLLKRNSQLADKTKMLCRDCV